MNTALHQTLGSLAHIVLLVASGIFFGIATFWTPPPDRDKAIAFGLLLLVASMFF